MRLSFYFLTALSVSTITQTSGVSVANDSFASQPAYHNSTSGSLNSEPQRTTNVGLNKGVSLQQFSLTPTISVLSQQPDNHARDHRTPEEIDDNINRALAALVRQNHQNQIQQQQQQAPVFIPYNYTKDTPRGLFSIE